MKAGRDQVSDWLGLEGCLAQFNWINPPRAAGGLDGRSDELLGQGFEFWGYSSCFLLSCTPYRISRIGALVVRPATDLIPRNLDRSACSGFPCLTRSRGRSTTAIVRLKPELRGAAGWCDAISRQPSHRLMAILGPSPARRDGVARGLV